MAVDGRGNKILGYGATGGEVSWLKGQMRDLGFYNDAHPDAALGADTYGWDAAEAVAAFQRRYGISPTGQMDEASWAMLERINLQTPDQTGGPLNGYSGAPERTTGTGTGGTGAPAAGAEANRDAMSRLGNLLRQYGLEGMLDWVRGKLIAGSSEAEITLEMYDQPAFKSRFPVIAQRQSAGLTPVSVADVLEYEQTGRELLRRAGIVGDAFTSSDYLQSMMGRDMSLVELQDRLTDGVLKVSQAPPEVRIAFGNYFGANSDAALATLFLDPEKAVPELEKMAATAYAGGVGSIFGLQLAQGIAREIADTGLSDGAIWQGFQAIDANKALFQESISETQDFTAENEGVAGMLGTRPGAKDLLARRAMSRAAAFAGGGGVGATQQGAAGLGVADS